MTTKIRVLLVEPSPLLGIKLVPLFGRKLERVAGPVTAAGMVSAVRDFEPHMALDGGDDGLVLVNLSGRGDKDVHTIAKRDGITL